MVQQLFFMELKFILESLLIAAPKPLAPGELRDILTKAADEEGGSEEAEEAAFDPAFHDRFLERG